MASRQRRQHPPDPSDDVVEPVLDATRVLVALSAHAVSGAIEDEVTLPQFRVLVLVSSQSPMTLGAVADSLGVHPSNATRVVDRLVTAGLLDRRDNPADRRTLALELTSAGHDLVERVNEERRTAIAAILDRMPPEQRRALGPAAAAFATASGDFSPNTTWPQGWTITS